MSAERRDRRSFEPPPWERDQYEELDQQAGKKTEESGGEGAAPAAQAPVADAPAAAAAPTAIPAEAGGGTTRLSPADVPEVVPANRRGGAGPGGDEIDPAQMAELMAGLKSEEPTASGFWKLGLAVAAGMVVLGAVMMVWGIVGLMATRGAGQVGWMAAAVLISFGIGFIAVGAWFAYKNLQKQGVL